MKEKDYAYRGWLLVFAVILALTGLSFVPSFEVFGLTTETVDILSELRDKSESVDESGPADYVADFAQLEQDLVAAQAESEAIDSLQSVAPIRYEWIVKADSLPQRRELFSEHLELKANKHQMPIEDFDTTSVTRLDRFIEKLIDGDDVRVAFLGDSFIEGDIITVDMREQLQQMFGGRGVGFVPCELPFAIYRTSVQRQASGWSSYSLLNQGSIPAAYKDRFFLSGYLSAGHRGATVRWKSTDVKPHLDSCSRARILVVSRNDSKVELTLNDTLKHEINIAGADYVRELYVEAPVSSIRLRVLSGEVLCHGASLEGGRGVMVDNLSIRGNSGHTIFGSSIAANTQIDKQLGYDLIVLEYGLNAMQPGQRNFSRYKQRLSDMIKYCQRCFPDAAIMVLGVSDRSVNGEGGWRSINSVGYLGPVQRSAAQMNGVCFWDLGKVVMSYGGINGFVSNGWAAGDHIHINFKGGARIAESLVEAIQLRAYNTLVKREGKDKDIACPIDLEPWKAFKETVTEEDLTIPLVLLRDPMEPTAVEVQSVETPKVEEPKREEPKREEPKREEPKREEPKREEPKSESPKKETPKAETPAVETPKVEEPKSEPVVVETPKVEAPKVAEPVAVETPAVEAPNTEAPKAETPKTEELKSESKSEPTVTETPKVEEPKSEPTVTETPKVEESKVETPKVETPKAETPSVEKTNPETEAK